MYETGTSRLVRSFHRMPGMPPPEGELHSHDYRLDVVVSRASVDDRGMVVDLDVLEEALAEVVTSIKDANLDEVIPTVPGLRGVTVEALARWVHDRLAASPRLMLGASLSVRAWESATAFGGYTAVVPAPVSSS